MTRYMRSHGYHSVMRSHRYRPILIILLVLLAAFLIFKVAGVGGINESNYEAQRNTRLRSEVQHAVSSVNSLSRLGASSSVRKSSCTRRNSAGTGSGGRTFISERRSRRPASPHGISGSASPRSSARNFMR